MCNMSIVTWELVGLTFHTLLPGVRIYYPLKDWVVKVVGDLFGGRWTPASIPL